MRQKIDAYLFAGIALAFAIAISPVLLAVEVFRRAEEYLDEKTKMR